MSRVLIHLMRFPGVPESIVESVKQQLEECPHEFRYAIEARIYNKKPNWDWGRNNISFFVDKETEATRLTIRKGRCSHTITWDEQYNDEHKLEIIKGIIHYFCTILVFTEAEGGVGMHTKGAR